MNEDLDSIVRIAGHFFPSSSLTRVTMMRRNNFLVFPVICLFLFSTVIAVELGPDIKDIQLDNPVKDEIRHPRQAQKQEGGGAFKPQEIFKGVGSALTNTAGKLINGVQHFVVGVLSGINDVDLINQGIEPIESTTLDPDEETTPNEEEQTTHPLPTRPPTVDIPITSSIPLTTRPPSSSDTPPRKRRTRSTSPNPSTTVELLPGKPIVSESGQTFLPLIHPKFPQYQLIAFPIQPELQGSPHQPQFAPISSSPSSLFNFLNSGSSQVISNQVQNEPERKFQRPPFTFVKPVKPIPAIVESIVEPEDLKSNEIIYPERPSKYTIRRKVSTSLPLDQDSSGGFNSATLGPVVVPKGTHEQNKDNGFVANKEDYGYPVPVDPPRFPPPGLRPYPELVEIKSGTEETETTEETKEETKEETEATTEEPESGDLDAKSL